MTLPSWNLNQFYESIEDNQINKDFKNLNSISKKFQNKYRGKLDSLSSESLLNSLKEYEKVEEVIQKIQSFAYLSYCTDQLEDKIKKFYQEVEEKLSNIEKKVSTYQFGCDDYLVKPFEPAELILRIRFDLIIIC